MKRYRRIGASAIRHKARGKPPNKRIRLEVNDLTRGLVGKYVDVYEMPDGRIQVRAKGIALPPAAISIRTNSA